MTFKIAEYLAWTLTTCRLVSRPGPGPGGRSDSECHLGVPARRRRGRVTAEPGGRPAGGEQRRQTGPGLGDVPA